MALRLVSESQLLSRAGYTVELTNPISFLHESTESADISIHPDPSGLRPSPRIGPHTGRFQRFEFLGSSTLQNTGTEKEQVNGDADHWNAYQEFRAGKHAKVLQLHRDAKGKYWNEGDNGGGGNGLHISAHASLSKKMR